MTRTNLLNITSVLLIAVSCGGPTKSEDKVITNQLTITSKADTIETGLWILDASANGVSEKGYYDNGFKIKQWLYRSASDSLVITWDVFDQKEVKFNIPSDLKRIENVEAPLLFQADIVDTDNNTYVALLRYDLKELKSSVYDYLYQYNESLKSNPNEQLKSKEFKKFTFKGREIFRAKVNTEQKVGYEATSYVFVVDNFLYDLSYKNLQNKVNQIQNEIINDMLYSMECGDVDLFNYNNKMFLSEENVEFK